MENIRRIFDNYDELENECFEALVEFMLKCPNNSWNIDITLMSTDFIPYDCKRILYSKEDSNVYVADEGQKNVVPVTELMYGETARIISSLPNEQMFENFEKLRDIISKYNVQGLLGDYPYFYEERGGNVQIIDINDFVGTNIKLDGLKIGGDKVSLDFTLCEQFVTDFVAHLNKSIMLCSDQYKTIKYFLDLQENLSFDIIAPMTMNCEGLTFNVVSIDTTDDKGFMIHGVIGDKATDTRDICVDALTLKPQDLDDLVEYISKIDVRDEIIDILQKLFNADNAYVITDNIIDAVIGEEINGHSLSEAVNIVLMRKMSLKL